jgi:hypothetical protein
MIKISFLYQPCYAAIFLAVQVDSVVIHNAWGAMQNGFVALR